MLTPQARVYLAVKDWPALEALVGADGRFCVMEGSGDGDAIRRAARRLQPDLAVLDMHLRGADGLEIMGEWRREMAAPPRVVFRCPYPGADWAHRARAAGADRVLETGEEGDMLSILWQTAQIPLPALAAPWAEKRREIAAALMGRLGVSPILKGSAYIREAAAALCCAPQLAHPLAGRLYPFLADRFSTTAGAVERAIRTAVEDTWLRGDLEAIQALFGFSVDADRGKPTNAEFLSMLSEHARRGMEQFLFQQSGG